MRCKASIEKSEPTIDFSHSFEMTKGIRDNSWNSCQTKKSHFDMRC
jgi:endonuclease IV